MVVSPEYGDPKPLSYAHSLSSAPLDDIPSRRESPLMYANDGLTGLARVILGNDDTLIPSLDYATHNVLCWGV